MVENIKRKTRLLIILCLVLVSCKKENTNESIVWLSNSHDIYTIPDIIDTIHLSTYKCKDKIKEDGKYALVKGYIQKMNVDYINSWFTIYAEEKNTIEVYFNGMAVHTTVNITDSSRIFHELRLLMNNMSDTSFQPIKLKVELLGWNYIGDGYCVKNIGFICHEIIAYK